MKLNLFKKKKPDIIKEVNNLWEQSVHFEILPYTREYNLSQSTRIRVAREAFEYLEITENDKVFIDAMFRLDQQTYNKKKGDIWRGSPHSTILGGWSCDALKKYLDDLGMKYSHCGNIFDLWIELKSDLTDAEVAVETAKRFSEIAKYSLKEK